MFSRRSVEPKETEGSPLVSSTVAAVCGLMMVLFVVVSWQARFVMDEFNLFQGLRSFSKHSLYQTLDPIKTVFGTELFRIATLASDSVGIMRAGRVLGLCAALGTMVGIFLISRELWPQARYRLLVLVSALSYSNVFERAFRIRTDTLALTFATGSLLFLVRSGRRRSNLLLSGALMGLSFLCTQKAVYLLAACFIALIVATWLESGWWKALSDGVIFATGWLVVFMGYAIYFGGASWWRIITMVLVGPRFVLDGTASFSGLGMFINQTLTRNLVPYAISLAGLSIALARWKAAAFPIRVALIATLIVTILIFQHDQPWPYVFVWPQVLLSLWVIPLTDWISERGWLTRNQAVLALTFLATLSLPRQVRYLNHTNTGQISVMIQAENLLEPKDTYFDGIGMIVDRDIAGNYPGWWWDTPTIANIRAALRSRDASALQSVMDAHPKLWILNYRILIMSDVVQRMVAGGYVRISPSLLLTGIEMKPDGQETEFACRWSGEYQLFDETGQKVTESIAVNGLAPAQVVALTPGHYRVRGPKTGQRRFLLPVGSTFTGPLGPRESAPDLFSEVYTY